MLFYVVLTDEQNKNYNRKTKKDEQQGPHKTRGSQEPVIAHLVFNLTSRVDRKWGCYT